MEEQNMSNAGQQLEDFLPYQGNHEDSYEKLINVLRSYESCRIVETDHNFVRARFDTPLVHFIDDMRFDFDDSREKIMVKTDSTMGDAKLSRKTTRFNSLKSLYLKSNREIPEHTAYFIQQHI